MTPEEKKLIKGFMFLSQKPILYALNIGESTTLGADLEAAVSRFKLDEVAHRPNAGATPSAARWRPSWPRWTTRRRRSFLGSYGLHESGLVRLIRKSYELLGLISFFTAGEDECRAWTIPVGSKAPQGARGDSLRPGTPLHPRRDHPLGHLLAAGSEAAARAKGTLRLEGKEYVVQDGDVMHIRHSG
jgi:ribosome-binding ATPase YchF (GTP1/OBG family)